MPRQVIIADDEPLIRMDLKAMLEQIGHSVVAEAEDGEAALYQVRAHKPDLVILDVMMPKKNGLELAEIINKERLAPVLILTAYSEVEMIDRANEAGVLAYLVKPFRRADLEPAIEVAVSRYREMLALEKQVASLQDEMEARKLIGRAKKILMTRFNLSDQEAFRRLQSQSLNMNKSLREVAEAIILANDALPNA